MTTAAGLKLTISSDVEKVNLERYARYLSWIPDYAGYFVSPAGREHYKLLSFLTAQLPNGSKVADLGTLYGSSALALATNLGCRVVTYDIEDHVKCLVPSVRYFSNVELRVRDCVSSLDEYLDSLLILLDIDPHDGVQERIIVDKMIEKRYRGIVVCDDINLNAGMREFWHRVALEKHDVTRFGHWSGTGIIVFDPSHVSVRISG
ncbi:MAG: hypothetical protein HYV63_05545 [Candidatus Schekmanbacteria bacterium]|nr:hypothetical protein [Candidatus Schekmanbacteria bacterium]